MPPSPCSKESSRKKREVESMKGVHIGTATFKYGEPKKVEVYATVDIFKILGHSIVNRARRSPKHTAKALGGAVVVYIEETKDESI